jgi:hypothetical protein
MVKNNDNIILQWRNSLRSNTKKKANPIIISNIDNKTNNIRVGSNAQIKYNSS